MIDASIHESHEQRVQRWISMVLHERANIQGIDEWCHAHRDEVLSRKIANPVEQSVTIANRAAGLEAITRLDMLTKGWTSKAPTTPGTWWWFYGRAHHEGDLTFLEGRVLSVVQIRNYGRVQFGYNYFTIDECHGVWLPIHKPVEPRQDGVL